MRGIYFNVKRFLYTFREAKTKASHELFHSSEWHGAPSISNVYGVVCASSGEEDRDGLLSSSPLEARDVLRRVQPQCRQTPKLWVSLPNFWYQSRVDCSHRR